MVMLNDLDRFHLVMDVIDRVPVAAGPRRATCARRWSTPGPGPGPTPASTARTARRSPAGPGRSDGAVLAVRVLVVNAGLQLAEGRPGRRAAGPSGTGTGCPTRRRTSDAVGHRIVHGGTGLHRAGRHRRGGRAAAAGPGRPGAAAPAEVAGRPGRGAASCCRSCRTSPASTPRSTPPCPPRRDVRAAPARGGSAGACAATASTGCPTPGRPAARGDLAPAGAPAWSPATSAPAPRWPRCSTGAASTPRWASRRSTGWSWPPAAASVDPGLLLWLEEHEGLRPHEVADALEHASGPARPGRHRRHARGPRAATTPTRALALDVYLHRLAAVDRRDDRRHSAAWTPWCSPAGWASGRPPCGPASPPGWPTSASPLDEARNAATLAEPGEPRTRTSPPRAPPSAPSSSGRARTSRSRPAWSGPCRVSAR